MSNVTIKDYEDGYQDWLKNSPLAKKAEDGKKLSTYDELENKALYQNYLKQAELLNQRQDAETEVQAQKETALRDNYIAQAQAQKKAQDTLKMQGMASGMSESGLIDLYAQGAAARAEIINANNDAKNDIFSEYRQALAESNAETNAAIAEIDAQREVLKESEKENAAAQITDALEKYNEDTDDFEDLKATYENFAPYLDEKEHFDIIQTYQNAAKDEELASELEIAKKEFEEQRGIEVNEVVSEEMVTKDFFGYNQNQFNAMKAQLEKAINESDYKGGDVVRINLRGFDNWNNSFFYKDGKFYKANTWWNNRIINNKEYDWALDVYPNKDSGEFYKPAGIKEVMERFTGDY